MRWYASDNTGMDKRWSWAEAWSRASIEHRMKATQLRCRHHEWMMLRAGNKQGAH